MTDPKTGVPKLLELILTSPMQTYFYDRKGHSLPLFRKEPDRKSQTLWTILPLTEVLH